MAPPYAIRVWYSPAGLHYEGRDGQEQVVPINEAGRLIAYLRQAAEHSAFAAVPAKNAELEWQQAIERKGRERRQREEERAAAARKGALKRGNRDAQRKADLKLLQELGL